MKEMIVLGILIAFMSCAKVKIYTVYPEETMKATEFWSENEGYDFEYTDDWKRADIKVRAINVTKFGPQGIYYGGGSIESINDWKSIAHEMGHHFGYDHSDNPNSIMYPVISEEATEYVF